MCGPGRKKGGRRMDGGGEGRWAMRDSMHAIIEAGCACLRLSMKIVLGSSERDSSVCDGSLKNIQHVREGKGNLT